MASQVQYYQAKTFLKSYNQAIQTLDDVHKTNSLLAKNLAYKDCILGGYSRGQLSIKNGELIKQKNFDNSKIKTLGSFSASNFAKDLTKFESAQSFSQLSSILQERIQ